MNKAFIREPDDDGKRHCPRCGALGIAVSSGPLDFHIRPESRNKIGTVGWFCSYPPCDVAYFDSFDSVVITHELQRPVYPKDPVATLCQCFGFTLEEIEADVEDGTPSRIRALLAKSQSAEARCQSQSPDGRCCLTEIKRLYMRLRG